jgi:hypothetical protein
MATHEELEAEALTATFSTYQWFMDGSYECVKQFVPLREAMTSARSLSRSVGGRVGTTVRIIITDGGDLIVWEWKHGQGVVFPTPEDTRKAAQP